MIVSPQSSRTHPASAWLRNAQIAVYAFMGVAAVSGLSYVFYSAFMGNALGAVLGAISAIGGVTLSFLALAAVRFGEIVLARGRHVDALLARLEALEAAFEAQGVPVDLARIGAAEADQLVAANLDRDVFPRLVKSAPAETQPSGAQPVEVPSLLELQWQSAYQNGDVAACRRVLQALREFLDAPQLERMEEGLRAMSLAKSAQLRDDFARLVRLRNYDAALLTGDEIARAFPDTAMAREFNDLRPHLIRRAQGADVGQHAPAI